MQPNRTIAGYGGQASLPPGSAAHASHVRSEIRDDNVESEQSNETIQDQEEDLQDMQVDERNTDGSNQ